MWLYRRILSLKDADGSSNSVDPDQTDLGLYCLPKHICPITVIMSAILSTDTECFELSKAFFLQWPIKHDCGQIARLLTMSRNLKHVIYTNYNSVKKIFRLTECLDGNWKAK